ncbi:MAG: transaldolase family protein, partial [Rhodoferax sp.]
APDTINTIPEKTLFAFADHGEVSGSMAADGAECEETLADFARAGVDYAALASRLQQEGAESFTKSWSDLMAVIASKSEALAKGQSGAKGQS